MNYIRNKLKTSDFKIMQENPFFKVITHLVFSMTRQSIMPLSNKEQPFKEKAMATNKKQLSSFINITLYYRYTWNHSCDRSTLLSGITDEQATWKWSEKW